MTRTAIDQAKAEAFSGQVLGHLNGAFLSLMISVGHQTGLFETMAKMPPATSQRIARAAKLNERYVREWLGSMVVGRIVEYNANSGTYRLPPEHAASLTRAAGPNNLGGFAQYVALMGNVEERIVDCFRNGGGVPYSHYPRFQKLQAEESRQIYDATLIQTTLPSVPGLIKRLKAGIDGADIGCGSGHAINLMARAFPKSRFTGFDMSREGVAAGRAEAKAMGLKNARFAVQDVAALNARGRFDFITAFDAIHDQAKPRKVLKGISKALRPSGTFLMVDIAASSRLEENLSHPLAPTLYAISTLHCMTVSLAYNGEGLGTVWGEQKARELLAEAGFTKVDVKQIPGDFLNNYFISGRG